MLKTLATDCIGFPLPFIEAAQPAAQAGFNGYWFNLNRDIQYDVALTRDLLARHQITAAGFNLPVEYRKDEALFLADLNELERKVRFAHEIGANRCSTWIVSSHQDLTYEQNFELHSKRLGKVCEVLGEYDMIFGLEFLGPAKLRRNAKYEFAHNLDQMLELCQALRYKRAGILMDVWHWDMAGQSFDDFKKFTNPDQVAVVHINDAPAYIDFDEQEDLVRRLPGETGVLKIAEFFCGLRSIGYQGPVLVEPFVPSLNTLSFDKALEVVMKSISRVWPKDLK